MANRQSLKELQERLAQRLSAAKTEGASASWLAVEAEGRRYLLPLVQSGEIFSWAPLQPIPYTQPWYAGVVSLRGGLLGVIDLARLIEPLAEPDAGTPVAQRVGSDTRLVSLHAMLGVNAVLWVDRLLGLRNPAMFTSVIERPAGAPAYFVQRLVDKQGLQWQALDLQALAAEPRFLAIAA